MTSDVKPAALVLLGALALLGRPSTADAHAGNNDPTLLHVCIGNVSKVVRSVGVSGRCIVGPPLVAETADHWSKEAIPGPKGDQGPRSQGPPDRRATRADGSERDVRGLLSPVTEQPWPCYTAARAYVAGRPACGRKSGTARTVPRRGVHGPEVGRRRWLSRYAHCGNRDRDRQRLGGVVAGGGTAAKQHWAAASRPRPGWSNGTGGVAASPAGE